MGCFGFSVLFVYADSFLLACNAEYGQNTAADKENCKPQCHMAVIAGLRCFFRTGTSAAFVLWCLDLKIRAALAVFIDNRKLMCADRKRVEVIGFQCDNGGTGDRRIILRVNQCTVNLNACEFTEIAVYTEG